MPATGMGHDVRPAASFSALVRSAIAAADAPLADWIAPVIVPGGNPVVAVPGQMPTSPPEMDVAPVFVIAEPASTAKVAADPRLTVRSVQLLNDELGEADAATDVNVDADAATEGDAAARTDVDGDADLAVDEAEDTDTTADVDGDAADEVDTDATIDVDADAADEVDTDATFDVDADAVAA